MQLAPRALAVVLALAFSLPALGETPRADPVAPHKTAESRLIEGRLAYERGDYDVAVKTLVPLLYPAIALSTEDGVIEAHRLLALSYILLKRDVEAEQEATSILYTRPSFQLDPIVDPPTAVAFFETVRRRQADRLREARERERRDAEARTRAAEEQRRVEDERRRQAAAKPFESGLPRSRLVATIPFGVGQWQNGQPTKAALFLSAEILFAVASVSGWAALEVKYPIDSNTHKRTYPPKEAATATGLYGLQLGAGAAFWVAAVWGVIDAHVLFKRKLKSTDKKTPVSFAPTIQPGLLGLGAQGAF